MGRHSDLARRAARLHARPTGGQRVTRSRCFLPLLALLALLALPVSPAWAAGGGGHGGGEGGGGGHGGGGGTASEKETPPRTKAQEIDGRYMQMNVLWLPVFQGSRSRYQAMTPRLVPHPDKRVLACFKAPWAQEAILFEMNEEPITVEWLDRLNSRTFKGRLLEAVHAHIGEQDVYVDIIMENGIQAPDTTETLISDMCR